VVVVVESRVANIDERSELFERERRLFRQRTGLDPHGPAVFACGISAE